MHRRRFLAAVSALSAAAAGCTSASGPAETSTTTTRTTTTRSTTTTGSTTAEPGDVHRVWVGRSFTYLFAGAHIRAHTVTGTGPLYVFAEVDKNSSPTLSLDDQTYGPASEVAGEHTDGVFYQ